MEKQEVELVDRKVDTPDVGESGVDIAMEKSIIHKVDRRLLPILGALYAVSLIDRVNMASAAVAGMTKDLKLYVDDRYSIALLMFFIPYFIFELPSNILLRRLGAANWLGSIALCWGAVMIGMGFIKDWRWLVVCRTILGFFEAGFFPGCVYLISCWYVRYEVQKRLAIFYLISCFASGFSSILAYGLTQMEGSAGLRGWRWIFIIEGIFTCVIALAAYLTIIDFPDKAIERKGGGSFLTVQDIEIIKARIERDRGDSEYDPLTLKKVGVHLSDWTLWAYALLFFCATVPSYAFAFFLPIILKGMGYSVALSQLLSAPPYVFGVIVAYVLAHFADSQRVRAPFIFVQALITIVGLLATAYAKSTAGRYIGTFLGIAGCLGNVPAILAYQSNNIRMNSKRAVGTALQVGFGSIGGIFASTVYRSKDLPRYLNGLWATVGCQFLMILLVSWTSFWFLRQNRRRRNGELREIEGSETFFYTI